MTWKIVKRNFEALKYPKGSPQRNHLNRSSLTSEFSRNCPYLLIKDNRPLKAVESIDKAKDMIKNPENYYTKIKKYTVDNFNAGRFWSHHRRQKYRV